MSWLFKSYQPNDPESSQLHQSVTQSSSQERSPSDDRQAGANVKEEISVIGQTLGRHIRGVANFLAPPPSSSTSAGDSSNSLPVSSPTFRGIRNDLVEIGGSFKSSLSILSANKAVSEISKFASQLLQFEDKVVEDEQGGSDGVPGTTDEVVRFVKQISMRPECWTEFPLSLDNDFSMSNAQREHALTIERLVPEFMELRQSLCSYMNVEKFWIIYFLLLLPRLNQHDFERLSTPKIVEARDVLMQKLSEKKNLEKEESENPRTPDTYQDYREVSLTEGNQKLTEITNAATRLEIDDKMSTEKWMEDTDTETISVTAHAKHQNEEDVSFSDLEDDVSDLSDRLSGHREAQDIRGSSPDGSTSDWVQLNESSERGGRRQKAVHSKGKDSEDESNDWLNVDDF
ncbi:hypothetical protein L6164_014300 [Bauhinia variegata]|uniref:Uncharacterized protein n=1 Tax=Bauhinia variegata TaxID=167791 RepID=A0ACB9NIB8_BAUVA|nr:hypothetical protein L6164_014300 [Bauhinia variegata]